MLLKEKTNWGGEQIQVRCSLRSVSCSGMIQDLLHAVKTPLNLLLYLFCNLHENCILIIITVPEPKANAVNIKNVTGYNPA